jgi:hypothetical protein
MLVVVLHDFVQCSDKIRAIFEMANHEFVWVSHDYVIPMPSFSAGMRSFGRGA